MLSKKNVDLESRKSLISLNKPGTSLLITKTGDTEPPSPTAKCNIGRDTPTLQNHGARPREKVVSMPRLHDKSGGKLF